MSYVYGSLGSSSPSDPMRDMRIAAYGPCPEEQLREIEEYSRQRRAEEEARQDHQSTVSLWVELEDWQREAITAETGWAGPICQDRAACPVCRRLSV